MIPKTIAPIQKNIGSARHPESSVEKYATAVFTKLGITDTPHTHRRVSAVLAFLKEQRDPAQGA